MSHQTLTAKFPTDAAPIPLNADVAPDLQLLVRRAGQRYAASLGEPYEPARHGGYANITAEEWNAWDRANAEWQARRRAGLAPPPARKEKRR